MCYLAMRIRMGALDYWKVVDRFSSHKDELDKYLRERYYMEPPKDRNSKPTPIIPQ